MSIDLTQPADPTQLARFYHVFQHTGLVLPGDNPALKIWDIQEFLNALPGDSQPTRKKNTI